MRLIDEKEIPYRIKKKSRQWLIMLKKIPVGKAWVVTEEEVGVKAVSLKSMVNRLKKEGMLSDNYVVSQRTGKDGKITIYVANSSKETI